MLKNGEWRTQTEIGSIGFSADGSKSGNYKPDFYLIRMLQKELFNIGFRKMKWNTFDSMVDFLSGLVIVAVQSISDRVNKDFNVKIVILLCLNIVFGLFFSGSA